MRSYLAALALGALLAACDGPSSGNATNETAPAEAATATAGTDPCSLVTAQEVSEVMGEQATAEPVEGGCKYSGEDATASSVTLELNQSDASGQMEIVRTAAGALGDMGAAVAGEGGAGADTNAMLSDSGAAPKIGDESFFGPNQQLHVRKGNSYIAVLPPIMRSRMSSGNPMIPAEEKKAMAVAIAQKAVARLP